MSDQIDLPAPVLPVPDNLCLVCRGRASFGFTSRRGAVWTCLAHRDAGERLLVAPSASARGGAP